MASSNILTALADRGFDRAAVGGLTTPICVQTTVDGLSMADIKVSVLADACASQAIGRFSAIEAHGMAIDRMGYVFAEVTTSAGFLARSTLSRE